MLYSQSKSHSNSIVLTILIPALNESLTISRFLKWVSQGIEGVAVLAEVIIVDSSTDATPILAREHGARVVRVPRRGLGRAYIDAIPYIRGRYVILGDADCTYDFRVLKPFIDSLDAGNDFVMGSRFRGTMEDGAMPVLHRYFGTPVTTAIFNVIYGTRLTDIHCGMRALTTDALRRLDLQSQGWEYASEMLLKAVRLEMRIAEVPINFLRAPDGRLTHHQRSGWYSPWLAGWENLRAMFTYAADYFLMKPGSVLGVLGVATLVLSLPGDIVVLGVTLALNGALVGLAMASVGLQMVLTGIVARCIYDASGREAQRWNAHFGFNRSVGFGVVLAAVGALLCYPFLSAFANQGFIFTDDLAGLNRQAVGGIFLIVTAFLIGIQALIMGVVATLVQRVGRLRSLASAPNSDVDVLEPLGADERLGFRADTP